MSWTTDLIHQVKVVKDELGAMLVRDDRISAADSISVVGVVVVRTCGPLAAPLPLFDVDGPGPGVPSLPPVRGHNGVDVVLDLD